jgi:TolB-like protein
MRLRSAVVLVCIAVPYLAACSAATQQRAGAIAADTAIRHALELEASIDPSAFPATSVGVLPLRVVTDDASLEPLGYGLAELIMTDLARSDQLVVVDRLRIHALLRELDLVERGVADPTQGPRLGRILGARHLLVGTLASDDSARFRVDANVARTDDSSVRAIVTGAASLDDVLAAQKSLVFRIFDALGVTLTPAERPAIEQRPTRNLGALLAFSRGVQAEVQGQQRQARREYFEALRFDQAFQAARERVLSIDAVMPDTRGVATITISGINGRQPRPISDIRDPAFPGRRPTILISPITVR